MRFIVIDISAGEIEQARVILGIDDLKERIIRVDQSVNDLINEVTALKATSDRVERGIDKVIEAVDSLTINAEDRAKLDQAVSTLRAENSELSAAFERIVEKVPGAGEEPGGDTGEGDGTGEDTGDGTSALSARKGVKKTSK